MSHVRNRFVNLYVVPYVDHMCSWFLSFGLKVFGQFGFS